MRPQAPPVLPGLFDPRVEPLPTIDRARLERDAALAQVARTAAATAPTFADRARAFVLRYLETHGPTAGEVLTTACKAAGIAAHTDRAFGPVFLALAREGRIVTVGWVPRTKGHGAAGGRVWGLVERKE